jgi:CYTH domain-containing protein
MSAPSMKYAHLECERRFLLRSMPAGVTGTSEINDLYVDGTRLRLREVITGDEVVRKLGQKIRLDGARRIAHTTIYLDDAEWALLSRLPGRRLTKRRHLIGASGVAVDEHPDGSLVAEIDGGSEPPAGVPEWLDVEREVTDDEAFTGAGRAAHG